MFPQKLEIDLLYDSTVALLGTYLKDAVFSELFALPFSLLLFSQELGNGNSLDVHQLLNR